MRVFCPQHKTGFLTPRRNPIRCENRGHVLGQFIFDGDRETPPETLWQYCCNCEHFCPIQLDQSTLGRCPACARTMSQLYVCDGCFTVSFESNTAGQTKNFTLTSDGAPQPTCPGCLQETSGELREHDCERLGISFITRLNSCPICLEHLDAGPVFPCSVAQYLRKTKAANKLNVAFDYESGLFLPLADGEFVLVTSGTENSASFVLPRSARFESKSDFFGLYQDYYHCSNVNAGEVNIIEPALVNSIRNGWKLRSTGVLEIVEDLRTTDVLPNNIPDETHSPVRERSALFSASLVEEQPAVEEPPKAVLEKPPTVTCIDCGSPVETRFAFCWSCGHPTKPAAASKQVNKTMALSNSLLANGDELTVQPNVSQVHPPIFSWALSQTSETSPTSSNVKLFTIVVTALALLTLGTVWLKGPASPLGRSADAQQVTSNLHSAPDVQPRVEATANAAAQPKPQASVTTNPAEEELQKLHERRIGASPSDRLAILNLFTTTEKQYPNDYRFPYERAKLAIDGRETKSHDDAFNALSHAAAEAIKSDKTQEMLGRLESDKFGDFHKLSHGHREWNQIIEALKKKDPTLLTPQ